METEMVERGTWVVIELFGHKVIAGYMSKDESLGAPLVRVDVPATKDFPSFTRHYNPGAIYSISYVSEGAAKIAAESLSENPVSTYVPELGELSRLQKENREMREKLEGMYRALRVRQLPEENSEV